ncbi:MAG: hypothetical protein V2A64_07340 [Candidatus Omnitrophota bacterium]
MHQPAGSACLPCLPTGRRQGRVWLLTGHKTVVRLLIAAAIAKAKSKRLGLRKSPITGDNKSSPKAIFLITNN